MCLGVTPLHWHIRERHFKRRLDAAGIFTMSIVIFVKHNQLYSFLRRVALLKEATLMVRQVVHLDGGRGAGDRVSLLKFQTRLLVACRLSHCS